MEYPGQLQNSSRSGYHVAILVRSAAIAFSLPWLAEALLPRWCAEEGGNLPFLSVEMVVAAALVILFKFLRQSYHDRQLAGMASWAGLVSFLASSLAILRKELGN